MSERETMDCATYMKQRVDDQIGWYNDNSILNQAKFKRFRTAEVVLAASIPVITTVAALCDGWIWFGTLLVAIIGGTIAVITGLLGVDRYHELWINYRTTHESLKKEKYYFLTGAKPYDNEGAFEIFVERFESLLSKENTNWSKLIDKQNTPKSD